MRRPYRSESPSDSGLQGAESGPAQRRVVRGPAGLPRLPSPSPPADLQEIATKCSVQAAPGR